LTDTPLRAACHAASHPAKPPPMIVIAFSMRGFFHTCMGSVKGIDAPCPAALYLFAFAIPPKYIYNA
jgi:hypothetical protein